MLNPSDSTIQALKEVDEYVENIKSGKVLGFTSGFPALDKMVGRIMPGGIWIIGGYTGTGKSYFILNMVDQMVKSYRNNKDKSEKFPKIVIFSSELTSSEYMLRHIFMRMGMFRNNLENYRTDKRLQELSQFYEDYKTERALEPYSPLVIGGLRSFDDFEKYIESLEDKPQIAIIDFVQNLTITHNRKLIVDEKDVMAYITNRIKDIAMKYKMAIITVSQINNYMTSVDNRSNILAPFSNGKLLNQQADTSIVLNRQRVGGELSPILEVIATKARYGPSGTMGLKINDGYQLEYISPSEAKDIITRFKNNVSELF